jgi:hypothetical protein
MREPRETGGNARSYGSNWTSRHTPVSFVMRKCRKVDQVSDMSETVGCAGASLEIEAS